MMDVLSHPRHPAGEIPVPVPPRPYAKIRGTEPSVTTVLGLLPKPGLPWGAARETAVFAVLHPDRWVHLEDDKAIDLLRKHHKGIWNGRAAMGTLCHRVNELYCDGEVVDIEALIAYTIANDSNARTWADVNRDDLIEQCLGYVLGLEKWWGDFEPEVTASEVVVRYPGRYIGQTDLRCTITATWADGTTGPADTLIDLKSTGKQTEGTGIYADSWSGQLNAYAFAPERVEYEAYEERGRVKVREVNTFPWSPPERLAVLHLRGDEDYRLYEVPLSKDTHEAFLSMADAYRWLQGVPKELPLIQPKEGD